MIPWSPEYVLSGPLHGYRQNRKRRVVSLVPATMTLRIQRIGDIRMDDLLTDQLEWLFSCNLQGNRLAHHLLIISGCLADTALPEHISRQMAALSRQVTLQEMFDTLVNALNQFSKIPPRAKTEGASLEVLSHPELAGLIAQIQDARQQLVQCDPVNYAEVIAWIAGQAREKKLWNKTRRR
jgi:hypothetical protein